MSKFTTNYSGADIYALFNVIDNKMYIGKSENIKKRFYTHKSLFLSSSDSMDMYRYPINDFVFLVIQKIDEEDYKKFGTILEELYIIQAKESGFDIYNKTPTAPEKNIVFDLRNAIGTGKRLSGVVKEKCGMAPYSIRVSKEAKRRSILQRLEKA